MTSFDSLRQILDEAVPQDGRPVVAYSGIWNLASAFEGPKNELVPASLHALYELCTKRTLTMPTYTSGFGSTGIINLDTSPGFTGAVNEAHRLSPESRRSASAFFSFASRGRDADLLASLRPEYAWGDNSVFDWIHREDAHLLMLGVPLHMCSFLHRIEWIGKVPYRYNKAFRGRMIHEGKEQELHENLFVRSYDPVAENIWPDIEPLLEREGLLFKRSLGRGFVLHIRASTLVDRLMKILTENTYAFVKNPEILKAKFGIPENQKNLTRGH